MEKEAEGMERYMIREAAKQVGVETHVLRYWEKELMLDVPKNDLGRRYYTSNEIALLRQIKYLKDQGFYLKSIRLLKDHISKVAQMDMARLHSLRDRLNGQLAETARAEEQEMMEDCSDDVNQGNKDNKDNKDNKGEINHGHNEPEKQTVFYAMKGVSTGVPAGVPTGKVVGTKVVPVLAKEEAMLVHQEQKKDKIDCKDEKSQLLELELVESKSDEIEENEARSFHVVQGEKNAKAEKEVTVLHKKGESLSVEKRKDEIQDSEKQTEISDADERMERFRMIMSDIIRQALRDNNKELAKDIGGDVSERVIKEMDFMMREQQEEEEERYRKLDETIRSYQRSRQETAVSGEEGKRKKRVFFQKNKRN